MKKVTALVFAALSVFLGKVGYDIFSDGELPKAKLLANYKNNYWGPLELQSKAEDTKIYPFKINVDDAVLKTLKSQLTQELDLASKGGLTPPLEGIGFEYGFNTQYLKNVLTYWKDKYDWRQREKIYNKYPQFKTKIEGLDIHFQHVKSANNNKYKKTLPLLLLHGWPGSFVELQTIIPLLTDPQNSEVNFEVVVPSLPGYGFSQAAVRPGLGTVEMAQIFLKLMQRLKHQQFYVHGGDWGSLIVNNMATAYPENVLGMHSNMCTSMHARSNLKLLATIIFPEILMSAEEGTRFLPFSRYFEFIIRETGYFHLQATKPDTVGVGLSLSPSGLAAYLLEKFSTWTDESGISKPDGDLTKHFTMDELLDNVMVYYVTRSITTSMRLYSEAFSKKTSAYGMDKVPIQVPCGCIVGGKDPYMSQTEWMVKDKMPQLIRYTLAKDHGHFFAMQNQGAGAQALSSDLIHFVHQVEELRNKKKDTKKEKEPKTN